ncbi:MAG: DEAD/DEAH box helicase, partial [Acidimicrobiia bacterium]
GEVAEAVLAGLNGEPFTAVASVTSELAEDLRQWAAPVLNDTLRLTVRLEPPERDGGWLLGIEAPGPSGVPLPIEQMLKDASPRQVAEIDAELRRLARLLPALRRTTRGKGQVVLDGGEAWDLMTNVGPVLLAAGFEVAVPALSRRRPSPRLQLHAEAERGPAHVGAAQLSTVHWSVVIDDVELDAAAVARLASDARPLVRVKGRWVELDRADLDAAAEALAEKSRTTQLSGAAILRHAIGLEGTTLAGPVSVTGDGWAVDLIHGASTSVVPLDAPGSFEGILRHYQAEARGWLAFLDAAGLGGCLALDMGLGKTPVVLAHILDSVVKDPADHGQALVIAPPAVLGNWAAEARRFTPSLKVHVHHGANRAEDEAVAKIAADADVVLTTYGTAVRDVDTLAGINWHRLVVDEAQAIKNPASETAQQLRRIPARFRLALTGTPVENGLGDLWSILDFVNPGLVGPRAAFVDQLSGSGPGGSPGERALRALNGLLVFRRTKAEPDIAVELPDKIDELDHCTMTTEQVGLYQAVLDQLLAVPAAGEDDSDGRSVRKGHILAAITALKQICDHPAAYLNDKDDGPLDGRSGKLARLEELVEAVFEAGERMLIFTHFARWGERLAQHLTKRFRRPIHCYHGGLARTARDRMVAEFQEQTGPGALVLSIKAGGSGLNLTAASHVVLYDRWWNPAVEDQARDRAWRIGQRSTVISHRLVCPGTVDERVEEVVAGKRRIADLVLPASSSLGDLGPDQLRVALGLGSDALIEDTLTANGGAGDAGGSGGADENDQDDEAA